MLRNTCLLLICCLGLSACESGRANLSPTEKEQALRIVALENNLQEMRNEIGRIQSVQPGTSQLTTQQTMQIQTTGQRPVQAVQATPPRAVKQPQTPAPTQNYQAPVPVQTTPVQQVQPTQAQIAQNQTVQAQQTHATGQSQTMPIQPVQTEKPRGSKNLPPIDTSLVTPPSSFTTPITVIPEPLLVLATTPGLSYQPEMPKVQPSKSAPKLTEQGLYETALQAFNSKSHGQAAQYFTDYLQRYPNGKYAPNAMYWQGEISYSQGKYPDAIMQFKDEITKFPKHHKTADSLLKIALSYKNIDDRENAALHLRILNEDFPKSEAAIKAKALGLVQ